MARKTESLIRLTEKSKEDLRKLADSDGVSQSLFVEKLIIEEIARRGAK